MKIIDFERKGNVIRFYLGDDDLQGWYGDDWDDAPYDCNADRVYDEFISGFADVYVPFYLTAMEPCDDWRYTNVPWCKDDMRERKVPCIIIVDDDDYMMGNEFTRYASSDRVGKIYFGDRLEARRYTAELFSDGEIKFVPIQ